MIAYIAQLTDENSNFTSIADSINHVENIALAIKNLQKIKKIDQIRAKQFNENLINF